MGISGGKSLESVTGDSIVKDKKQRSRFKDEKDSSQNRTMYLGCLLTVFPNIMHTDLHVSLGCRALQTMGLVEERFIAVNIRIDVC